MNNRMKLEGNTVKIQMFFIKKMLVVCGYYHHFVLGSRELIRWSRDEMDANSQTTFSSAFSWMKIFEFRLKFHWSLFLMVQLTIFQHWFRQWLGAGQATSHYLNQWWLIYRRIYASLGLNELMRWSQVTYICFNSKPSLVQIMSCRLITCQFVVNWNHGNKLQWNFIRNSHLFIEQNTFEKMPSAKRCPFCLGLNVLMCHIATLSSQILGVKTSQLAYSTNLI